MTVAAPVQDSRINHELLCMVGALGSAVTREGGERSLHLGRVVASLPRVRFGGTVDQPLAEALKAFAPYTTAPRLAQLGKDSARGLDRGPDRPGRDRAKVPTDPPTTYGDRLVRPGSTGSARMPWIEQPRTPRRFLDLPRH